MIFRPAKANQKNCVCYEAVDNYGEIARFSFSKRQDGECRITELYLYPETDPAACIRDILEFIQYKAWIAGCGFLYLELSEHNHLLLNAVKNYGFRMIDHYFEYGSHGEEEWKCVLQYTIQ